MMKDDERATYRSKLEQFNERFDLARPRTLDTQKLGHVSFYAF